MDDLQRVLDEAAIRRVLVRYCRGVDRGDEELIRSVYWPDASDEHGDFKGSAADFALYVVRALDGHALITQHAVVQSTIEIEGERAHVESYVLARHKVRREAKLVLETFGGRYIDRFEQRAGEWRIARRQVVHDWSKIEEIQREYPHDAFPQGKRGRDDASYRR